MKNHCYSLCKTVVLVNPKDNGIFINKRILTEANKHLGNERAREKIPGPTNMPLSNPINDRDMNEALTYYHSEKQIARWLIKKSEYNESTIYRISCAN
ncbi:hypothetical protein ACIQXI_06125 [Lysinibacillus sp. NPDC097195]|uniref:hypothetical protein n=1 Tax=Lysinibacillus sp. NPDC097195 TaxID=3364141 RepID=UPI0037F83887